MKAIKVKPLLFKLHRWIGLALTPLFLLIALSGAALAFKPILTPHTADETQVDANPIPINQVIGLIEKIDPMGDKIKALSIDHLHNRLMVQSTNPATEGRYDLSSGSKLTTQAERPSVDLFAIAEGLHKELLMGADLVIQIAAYLMLFMLVIAPWLAWPRFKHSLLGWHRSVGWILLPLILMLPVSGILMSLHVGMPELPRMSDQNLRLSLTQALQSAAADNDLSELTQARRFRGGSILLTTGVGEQQTMLVVTDRAVTPLKADENLVKSLHEGTWGGALSGSLNLLGATTLGLLSLTGVISWTRRKQKRRRHLAQALAS
jgi:sulfite reductase (NADPH) flavoprotein alpha-component